MRQRSKISNPALEGLLFMERRAPGKRKPGTPATGPLDPVRFLTLPTRKPIEASVTLSNKGHFAVRGLLDFAARPQALGT